MVAKLSVSLSEELTAVLDELARRRGDDRSPLIETLLRENPIVQEGVALWRKEAWTRPAPPPPGGQDDGEARLSATLRQLTSKLTDEQRDLFLLLLGGPPELSVRDVSALIGRSRATTVKRLDTLLALGLIQMHDHGATKIVSIHPTVRRAAPKDK